MRLFLYNLCLLLVVFFFAAFFPQNVLAQTTPFRSANVATTEPLGDFFTNLENCSVTDGLTCDRAYLSGYGYLYFSDFGSYDDFGIPLGSIITKVRLRVTGKENISSYDGLNLFAWLTFPNSTLTLACTGARDLIKVSTLSSDVISVQDIVVNVSNQAPDIYADCLKPEYLANKNLTFILNHSSGNLWSANIDNFEVAFDYEEGPAPTITPTPTLTSIPSLTPTPTAIPTPTKTPLIIIPGIGGSELKSNETFTSDIRECGTLPVPFSYIENDVIWVDTGKAALSPCDDYFDVLKIKPDGITPEYPQIVLNGTLFPDYNNLINFFEEDGYELNRDLFIFPYDWRIDIFSSVPLLEQKIEAIEQQTGSSKVNIIAHSMGGLVARSYISSPIRAQNVDKLFALGTPHLGSVNFLKAILYGDQLGPKFLFGLISFNPSELKDVIQNMVGGYELAPTQKYYEFYSGEDNNHPYPFADLRDVDSDGLTGILNYYQTKNLLTNLGHNTSLFGPSESFHNLDNNLVNTNGVEVINIAGSGLPTLGQIFEYNSTDFLGNKIPHKDEIDINGDKTVPLFSASLTDPSKGKSLLGDAKVFYTNQEHGNLVASGPALNLVKNILEDNYSLPSGVSTQPYNFNGIRISSHSPVNLHVYDSSGNHTGPTQDGDFEENIPGSTYDTLDDSKFIWLPINDEKYNIKLDATDQGSFDFKIKSFYNNENLISVLYENIPLINSTKAQLDLDPSADNYPEIQLDENGDGISDQQVPPAKILIGDENYDSIPPQTSISITGTKGNSDWYTSNVIVALTAKDNDGGSGISKTEYTLDNGKTIQNYSGPFTISKEAINQLEYKSTDNAGNEESAKKAEIKIDKTSPEAKVYVDQDKQDLVVEGLDNNSTTVKVEENLETKKKYDAIYTITDLAGNSIRLDVRDRDKNKKDRFKIYSIQYNDDLPEILEDNHFNVSYKGKKERANVKEQNFEVKGEMKIRIQYDNKKDISKIIVKESKQEKVKEIKEGLIILNLITKEGDLRTIY